MKKIGQFWAQLPAALRLLLAGAGLLGGILLGGAITAYGGVLLLFLMSLLCLLGTGYLLDYAGQTAIGADSGWRDKHFRAAFGLGAALGFAVLVGLIYYRKTLYYDDFINYWSKQDMLRTSFATNGFYGVHLLAENLLTADYKMFCNLYLSLFYEFTTHSVRAFMICMYFGCILPGWYAMLLLAQKVGRLLEVSNPWYLLLAGVTLPLWPVLMWPITHAMPDALGLTFVGAILLLCWDYDFDSLPLGRLAAIFAATFCLVITRRWYLYWIVGFYACYVLTVLWDGLRRKALWRRVRNMAIFGGLSAVGILAPLALTFLNILRTDYAGTYGGFYGGGIGPNLREQLHFMGWLPLALALAGLAAALVHPKLRCHGVRLLGTGFLCFVLLARVQTFGAHHSLILIPTYLFGWLVLLALAQKLPGRNLCYGAAAVVVAVNFGASLGLMPGLGVFTGQSADLTRRADLPQVEAITDFVLEHCGRADAAYLNIGYDGYSGNAFRFSGDQRLRDYICWESCVPATHGFSTNFWTADYVMVTDTRNDDYYSRINRAFLPGSPVLAHFEWVQDFPLGQLTVHCYRRTAPADRQEADYLLELLADYDEAWPGIYSQRMDAYFA